MQALRNYCRVQALGWRESPDWGHGPEVWLMRYILLFPLTVAFLAASLLAGVPQNRVSQVNHHTSAEE